MHILHENHSEPLQAVMLKHSLIHKIFNRSQCIGQNATLRWWGDLPPRPMLLGAKDGEGMGPQFAKPLVGLHGGVAI